MVFCWLVCSFFAYSFREQTSEALVNRLGFIYNGFGLYFLFRTIIQNDHDIERVIKILVILSIPFSIALLVERITGHNLFSVFGGVPEYSWIRDGKIRAQGPFAHAILAGTFGASLAPLFLCLLFKENAEKVYGLTGFSTATIIVWCAASSVSFFSYASGLAGMAMWRARSRIRLIQWSVVIILTLLHMIMKAPVWYLLSRAGEIMGGTGWHRAYLIDQAIAYFDEWWLVGTGYTAHWFPYALPSYPNQTDITNQFILQGVNGGIMTMILFVAILVSCFKRVGAAVKGADETSLGNTMNYWSLGTCLLVMVVSFMGVTYFDQMMVVWYLLIAMIAQINIDRKQIASE
jgi:hypothetical protein